MKKTITLLGLATIASGLLVGCATGGNGASETRPSVPDAPSGETSAKQVFLTQAVTGLQLAAPSAPSAPRRSKAGPASEEEKAEFLKILPTVDLLFDNGKAFSSQIETVHEEVEGVVYECKETIAHLGSDLQEVTYTLLYNKEALREEEDEEDDKPVKAAASAPETSDTVVDPAPETSDTVVDPAPETSDTVVDPAPESSDTVVDPAPESSDTVVDPAPETSESRPVESESEWLLTGYAYLDEETRFPFVAKIEEEQDGQEAELERFFRIETGKDSRILVKEEFETEGLEKEQELSYTVVEEGKTVLDYKIEPEQEGKENELEIELGNESFEIERTEENGETVYSFERKTEAGKVVASFKKVVDGEGNVSYEAL